VVGMSKAYKTHRGDEKYKISVGKPEGKRPLGSLGHRLEGNIKTYLKVVGCQNVNWIHLAQDRDWLQAFVNTVMNRCVS
jgi:hypothetical protein